MTWSTIPLGEICSPKQHPTISTAELTAEGYPAFGANGQIGLYKEFTHDAATIAITCRGATCGTVNIVPAYSYISGNAMALDKLDTRRVELRFLAYALRLRGFSDVISGSAQPQITRGPLLGVQVPLPPLPEQRRIAAILDQADELRRKRQLSISALDALVQSVFREMFGEFLRDGERITLGNIVAEFRYGTSNKSSSQGRPTLRIPNIVGSRSNLDDLKYVPVDEAEYQRLKLNVGDILFVRTNGNPDYVGRSAVIRPTMGDEVALKVTDFIFASYLIRARLKPGVFDPAFVQMYLSTDEGRSQIKGFAKTSAGQFNINTEGLAALTIPKADLHDQLRFLERAERITEIKKLHAAHLARLDSLFTSLLHRAFNGELTSKDAERELVLTG